MSVNKAMEALKSFSVNGGKTIDPDWILNEISLTIRNTEGLYKGLINGDVPSLQLAAEGLLEALKVRGAGYVTGTEVQEACKELGVDFKEILDKASQDIDDYRLDEMDESKKVEDGKLVESTTDTAVEAINKYTKEDGSFDKDWFNEDVQLTITNTEYLVNKMNSKSQAHTVAYEGMLQVFENNGYNLTSRQVQAGFKKLGLDFKEILEPTTEFVEQRRKEEIDESKKVEAKEDILISPTAEDNFKKLKAIMDEGGNNQELDGFYFPGKAIKVLKNCDTKYHLNSNMDLTISNILNDVGNYDSIQEVIDSYFEEYNDTSATTWGMNFVTVMSKIDPDNIEDEEIEDMDESKKIKTESVESENIERIQSVMKASGIKNPNTLDRMSKDILKTLDSNCDKDCKDETGNYYFPVITNAIQDKIEQITGKRPNIEFEPKTEELRIYEDPKEKGLETETKNKNSIFTARDVKSYLPVIGTEVFKVVKKDAKSANIGIPEGGQLMSNNSAITYELPIKFTGDSISLGEEIGSRLTNVLKDKDSKVKEVKCVPEHTKQGSILRLTVIGQEVIEVTGKAVEIEPTSKKTESVDWSYYNKFKEVNDKYLPSQGQGDTLAEQIVTCVNKLVYKWYNDGDVYDNVNSYMPGWANDLSSYANWLDKYCEPASRILDSIYGCGNESTYEDILKELADKCLDKDYLITMEEPKQGDIYNCDGQYEFREDGEYYDDMYESREMQAEGLCENTKLQETGEWDDNDEEMQMWLDSMRDGANEIATNIDGKVKSVTGFDAYQGPQAVISTPIHGDVVLWYDNEDDTGRTFNCKIAHTGWIQGDINRLSDLLMKEVIPEEEILEEGKKVKTENGDIKKAVSYYDDDLRGVEDTLETENDEEIKDFIWGKLNQGNYVKLKYTSTGNEKVYTPEDIIDDCDIDLLDESKEIKTEDESEEEKTALDVLQDDIGKDMSVGELNTHLQAIFSKFDTVFLLRSDLYNLDPSEPQELVVNDDGELYVISYMIKDLTKGIVEITDANIE